MVIGEAGRKWEKIFYHNPQATAPILNAEEIKQVGETVARKLNQATGPIKVLIPTRGFSAIEYEGSIFFDELSVRGLIETLRGSLNKNIEIMEIAANINDDEFAEAVGETFLNIVRQ